MSAAQCTTTGNRWDQSSGCKGERGKEDCRGEDHRSSDNKRPTGGASV